MTGPSIWSLRLRAAEHLALDRARIGLERHRVGWRTPGLDPDDLIDRRTVKALARRGLITITPDGRRAERAVP
jgi:hypothetical protein